MADVVNIADKQARDLPARISYALAVRELITLPSLAGSTLLAGAGGLDQIVAPVNVIEVPDILPWVKPNELLLTTGFPIRFADSGQPFDPQMLVELIERLARCSAAALGVKAGKYLDELPRAMIDAADRLDFPLFLIAQQIGLDEVMSEVFMHLVDHQAWALDVADRVHRALTTIVREGCDLPQIADEVAALLEAAVLICSPDEAVAPVIAGGANHDLVVTYALSGGLGPATVQALERAATVVALAITKRLAVSAVESKFRGDFLRDVLSGNAGSPDEVVQHCAQLDCDVRRNMEGIVGRFTTDANLRLDLALAQHVVEMRGL